MNTEAQPPIVAAVDFAADSRAAISRAARLASTLSRPLHLVHVVAPGPRLDATSMSDDAIRDVRSGQRSLAGIITALRSARPGIPISCEVDVGNPADSLVRQSAHAALLVMGARGRDSYPYRWGSTSENVATRALCPVIVVRAEHAGGELGAVVVEAAAATQSDEALHHAARIAGALAEATGGELIEVLEANGRRCEPARLVQAADDHDAALLVIAEPRLGSSGSIAVREVIERTDRPVMIVHDVDELVVSR